MSKGSGFNPVVDWDAFHLASSRYYECDGAAKLSRVRKNAHRVHSRMLWLELHHYFIVHQCRGALELVAGMQLGWSQGL